MDQKTYHNSDDLSCSQTGLDNGALVHTACGGVVQLTPQTPCASVEGRPVFFCLPVCKTDYERDATHSCLSTRASNQDSDYMNGGFLE